MEAKTDPRKMARRERYPMDNERHVLTVYWDFVLNMASQIILWLYEYKFRITSQQRSSRPILGRPKLSLRISLFTVGSA